MHILRANLLTTHVSLFYKKDQKSDWQEMCGPGNEYSQYITQLETKDNFYICYKDDGPVRIIASLPLVDKSYFGLLCGQKIDDSEYTDYDKIAMQIFMQLFDNAYQAHISLNKEKELVFSLNQSFLQLNSLIDTGIELSNLKCDKSLLSLALERVVGITNASRGLLKIRSGRKLQEKFYFPAHFPGKKSSNHTLKTSFKLFDQTYTFELFDKESRNGDDAFNSNDRLLLDGFSRQLAGALENDYLHEQELQHQKIEQEVALAATIQQKILPEKLPEISGYDLHGVNIPTKHVGGDYYNCIPISDDRFALVIADVSGKGVPAALLVNSLHSALFAYIDDDISLPPLATKLNSVISDASTDETYITFFIALLNSKNGELQTLNAGHNPIYMQKNDGTCIELKTGGIPFGMLDVPFPYQEENVTLEPGEQLLLYTDGITEAMDKNFQEYDQIKSLKKFLENNKFGTAELFITHLIDDIQNFTGNTTQSDDITALYLLRK
jgi:serine phosphatase RsbU (regulator of sigma subunit)